MRLTHAPGTLVGGPGAFCFEPILPFPKAGREHLP